MERKKLFTILGVIGAVPLLILVAAFPLIKNLTSANNRDQNAAKITLCDKDASDLCVITFGAGVANDMMIIFQLPKENYPAFYVKASNKGVENTYTCEADSSSNIIFCTGVRTPLGELIDVQVYSSDGDLLIANGTFMVSSIAMTFSNGAGGPLSKIVTPTPTTNGAVLSTSSTPEATPTITATPDAAYPNP